MVSSTCEAWGLPMFRAIGVLKIGKGTLIEDNPSENFKWANLKKINLNNLKQFKFK